MSKETQVIPFHLHSSGKNLYDLPKKENCDICYIMHTSGSSGEPKGVKVTFEAFQHFLTWVKKDFQITEKDRFAHTSSLGFGASLRQIFSPFLSGSTLVCFHPLVLKSPRALLENLKKKKITVFKRSSCDSKKNGSSRLSSPFRKSFPSFNPLGTRRRGFYFPLTH